MSCFFLPRNLKWKKHLHSRFYTYTCYSYYKIIAHFYCCCCWGYFQCIYLHCVCSSMRNHRKCFCYVNFLITNVQKIRKIFVLKPTKNCKKKLLFVMRRCSVGAIVFCCEILYYQKKGDKKAISNAKFIFVSVCESLDSMQIIYKCRI